MEAQALIRMAMLLLDNDLKTGRQHGNISQFNIKPDVYSRQGGCVYGEPGGNGGTLANTATVSITTINQAPVANAGAGQAVYVNNTVTLDGSGSSDVDGDPLTYNWAFTSRPVNSAATLNGSTSANPTFTVDKAGTYVVSLVVNDGTVDSAAATVTITTLNSAPVANAGAGQSAYVGNTVTLDGSGSFDVDENTLSYNWTFSSRPVGSTATLSNSSGGESDLYCGQGRVHIR